MMPQGAANMEKPYQSVDLLQIMIYCVQFLLFLLFSVLHSSLHNKICTG